MLDMMLLRLLCIAATIFGAQLLHAAIPDGFVPLFNGKDLTGWKCLAASPAEKAKLTEKELLKAEEVAAKNMAAHWRVVDGNIVCDGKGLNLCTEADFADFELYVDWKIEEAGDSGIYLRGTPQVQIWDTTYQPYWVHGAEKGSGGIWNNQKHTRFPLEKADKPLGEWNTFQIRMVGEKVTVKLNGTLVTNNVVMENYWDPDKPVASEGAIELQGHGHRVSFRNIYLRELAR